MKDRTILRFAAALGIMCGLLSTFPFALGPVTSVMLWSIAGVALGILSAGKRIIVYVGVLYGLALSITFLFSRFGGSLRQLPSYTVFVLIMSIVGAFGGVFVVSISSYILLKFKK
jgi:hypothetical protein